MFSRPRPPSEGAEPTSTSEPPGAHGADAARAFDQVLSELQPPDQPAREPDAASVTASATEHAATLRATRDAQKDAQALLAMANETRQAASEEAERIVLEARDAAERSRQELAGWAAAQRAKVEALAADLAESARHDADAIRAEALRTSMMEAEDTARRYVAEAAANAQTDADAIRAEARNVLNRATELGEDASEAVRDLTTTMADIMSRLQATRSSMEQLLTETRADDLDYFDEPVVDEDGAIDEMESTEIPGDPPEIDEVVGETEDEDEYGAEATGDEVGQVDTDTDTGADRDVRASDPFFDEQADRQLGSMFRRHGQRGD